MQPARNKTKPNNLQVVHVLHFVAAVDDDIVEIDLNTLASQIAKHIVHDPLEWIYWVH